MLSNYFQLINCSCGAMFPLCVGILDERRKSSYIAFLGAVCNARNYLVDISTLSIFDTVIVSTEISIALSISTS